MADNKDFVNVISAIISKDDRYDAEAYRFVLDALDYTLRKLKVHRHVSGKELLTGIKDFGLREYGPMARTVLEHWGVKTCRDFGEIVFNLVENGFLKRTQNDSINEFEDGYDFFEAFEKPFQD